MLGGPIGSPRPDASALTRVRDWARELWAIGDDGLVLVSELRCSDPGCPPHETAVLLVDAPGEDPTVHKVAKPAEHVTREDLLALVPHSEEHP